MLFPLGSTKPAIRAISPSGLIFMVVYFNFSVIRPSKVLTSCLLSCSSSTDKDFDLFTACIHIFCLCKIYGLPIIFSLAFVLRYLSSMGGCTPFLHFFILHCSFVNNIYNGLARFSPTNPTTYYTHFSFDL